MSQPIAFDPAAPARVNGQYEGFVEVTLAPAEMTTDGYLLRVSNEDGVAVIELILRPDFLDALLDARAREAAA